MKGGALVTAACLLAMALAGCSGSEFSATAAPVWDAGFAWTYAMDARAERTGLDGESQGTSDYEQKAKITVRVTNTTVTHEGEPLYVVDAGDYGLFLLPPGTTALRQSDLALVAQADYFDDACELQVRRAAALVPFPLQSGASWEVPAGSYLSTALKATILGQETVDVPAGRFTAIHGRLQGAETSEYGTYAVRLDF